MKIIHRISERVDGQIQNQLSEIGIEVELGLVTFEIDESHPSWKNLEPMISAWRSVDIVTTKFTANELKNAAYLRMAPRWHHGYPQPDGDFGYRTVSYSLANFCSACGIGKRQTSPIRMAGEPKWGQKHILQLNWIFDEYFVRPEVWKDLFEPVGVGCLPVVHHRTGKDLRTVVQLDIMKTESALQISDDQPCDTCTNCGRKKYQAITRGPFPSFDVTPTSPIQKTKEYFGSGGSAWNAIVVSSDLVRQISDRNLKGVYFIPCDRMTS